MNRQPVRAFTLIELLVVVAVVSLLMGILLPSLRWSREVAQSMVGASNVRQLVVGQIAHAADNDGWIAGPNTTGIQGGELGEGFVGSTADTTPTTDHDWISPIFGGSLGFSPNRAERTRAIFERFACPKAVFKYHTTWSTADDEQDFQELMDREPFLQLSYLSPASFHYVSTNSAWNPRYNGQIYAPLRSFSTPFLVPTHYRPRIDLIKNLSNKIGCADGFRYTDYRGGGRDPLQAVLDFDLSPRGGIYGSFTSSGPIFDDSREYGRGYQASISTHIDLSMRYFGEKHEMHVAYWDGHAGRIPAVEAWSDPVPWYPSGSRFRGGTATDEVMEKYEFDERLP